MKIAFTFWYYKAITPETYVASLTEHQWEDFLHSTPEQRQRYIPWLFNLDVRDVREMWWLPLDGQSQLSITPDTKILKARSNKGISL